MLREYPFDYFAEYQRRIKIVRAAQESDKALNALNVHYANNCIDFIQDLCVTYDPRPPKMKKMPFILFKRQTELVQFLLECVEQRESGLVEKCRDAGLTWLAVALSSWMWRYQEGSSIGFGSRKEDLVDKIGNMDSILEKVRFTWREIPTCFHPRGFDINAHMPFMKIMNPENGSLIKGESGPAIGRGGRSNLYFADESAHYEQAETIQSALSENTEVIIDISSVKGTNNIFYRRRMAGEVWYPGCQIEKGKTRVFVFDWRDHPGKTQEWYDRKRKKAEAEGLLYILAQEVDRDYSASIEGIIIPQEWVKASVDAHVKLGFGPSGDRMAALDVADEGGDKNALAIRNGVILTYIDDWGQGDTGESARKALAICNAVGVRDLQYDAVSVGAGVKTEANRLKQDGKIKNFNFIPYNGGSSVTEPEERIIKGDLESPTNQEFYYNRKAQDWWNLRLRFEKTFKAVTKGEKYAPSELISLPSSLPKIHDVCRELSTATYYNNTQNETLVNKKGEGQRSPNMADAVVMAYSGSSNIRGDIFSYDWFNLCGVENNRLPTFSKIFQSLYCPFEDETGGGYKACITFGVFNPEVAAKKGQIQTTRDKLPQEGVMILDCWRERLSFPDLRRVCADDFNSIFGQEDQEIDFLLVEDAPENKQLIKELSFAGIKTFGYDIGSRDKLSLAHSVTHLVENGLIWFPRSSRIAEKAMDKFIPLIRELLAYNRGPDDQFVHSFTQGLRYCSDRGYLRTPEIVHSLPELELPQKKNNNPYAI